MTKLLLITSVILFVLFQSCEKDHYYRISRKDWTKLNVGDTIIYNYESKKDSFIISTIDDSYYTSDKLYHTEFLFIYYNKINIPQDEKKYYYNFSTYRNYKGVQIEWKRFNNGNKYDTTLILYKNVIINVWSINNSDIYGDTLLTDTKKVFYTNKLGVIQYELYNGQTFIMDSTILNKYMN